MTFRDDTVTKIPEHLVYEMDNGVPIFYKGYKSLLNDNQNSISEMPETNIQAWLKSRLIFLISLLLESRVDYLATVGEQGLSLQKKNLARG